VSNVILCVNEGTWVSPEAQGSVGWKPGISVCYSLNIGFGLYERSGNSEKCMWQ
jgi:hypothetical protein